MEIEQKIKALEQRNRAVEENKRWETSWFRQVFIATITYCVAFLWMTNIGVTDAYLSAFIPTGGYLLSTLSLSYVRGMWMRFDRATK